MSPPLTRGQLIGALKSYLAGLGLLVVAQTASDGAPGPKRIVKATNTLRNLGKHPELALLDSILADVPPELVLGPLKSRLVDYLIVPPDDAPTPATADRRAPAFPGVKMTILPPDFLTHKRTWRSCIAAAAANAPSDDKAYFEHELEAFDRAYAELEKPL